MKWEYIIGEVFLLCLKFLAIFVAHRFAKFWTAQSRSSTKPDLLEKVLRYGACVGVAAIIGFFTSGYGGVYEDDDGNTAPADWNRGSIVFIALLIPALFGVTDGFTTENRHYTSRISTSSRSDGFD